MTTASTGQIATAPSQPYAVIDIYHFMREVLRSKLTIAKWIVAFTLFALLFALRPSAPTVNATVRIDPQEMRGLLSAGLLNVDSEIGMIKSWSMLAGVVKKMNYFGQITLPGTRPSPLEETANAQTQALPDRWLDVSALHFPPSMLQQEYRLVIARDDEEHDYQLETTGPIDADIIMRGKIGVSYMFADNPDYRIRVEAIYVPAGTRFTVKPMSEVEMTRFVQQQLDVYKRSTHPGSSLIDMEIATYDIPFGLKFLNRLAEEYIGRSYDRLTASKHKALARLEKDVQRLKQELDARENELQTFLSDTMLINPQQLSESLLEHKQDLTRRLSEARTRQQKIQLTYTTKHPSMIAVKDEIAQLKEELAETQQVLALIPLQQNRMKQMERNVKMAADLYESMIDKYAELQVDIGGVVNTVSLINEARLMPDNRIKRAVQIIILGGMMGLIIAFAIVLVRASMRQSVIHRAGQLIHFTTIPVSSYILRLTGKNSEAIRCTPECIQALREQLPYITHGTDHARIAVTAPRNYAATAELTIQLARASAASGRTLLIDGFVHNSPLKSRLEAKSEPGLSDMLAGKNAATAPICTIETQLDYLPCGTNLISFQVLERNEALLQILESLRPSYQRIIIFLPDPLLIPQATRFLNRCDYLLHLVRIGMQIDKLLPHLHCVESLGGVHQLILPYALNETKEAKQTNKRAKRKPPAPPPRPSHGSAPDASRPVSSANRRFVS